MSAITWKDQPRALRNGVPLVGAAMTFRDAATDELTNAYADPRQVTPLPNPLLSDAGGRFPPIYLQSDIGYRVTLVDVEGLLVYEEDPFTIFPGSDTGIPLDDTGAAMPECVLTFWRADTTILADIFDDDSLTDPLDNPLTSDTDGQFPDIFLDDEEAYRVRLRNAAQELIYDVSDYQHTPQLVSPSPPVLSGVLVGLDGELTWTEATAGSEAIAEYQLFRSVDGGPFVLLATIPVADPREYTDEDLTPDVIYQYFVVAVDTGDHASSPSNIVQLLPLQDFAPLIVAIGLGGGGGVDGTDGVMTSPDGINWTQQTTPSGVWRGICYSPELQLFVVVASGTPELMTSPDGVTWTARSAPLLTRGVAWSPTLGLFAAVGHAGAIMTSPDGINWTARTAPEAVNFECIVWAPEFGEFLAGSITGSQFITTSANGVTWTLAASSFFAPATVYALTFSGSRAVTASRSDFNLYSDDGQLWFAASFFSHGDITYGLGLFVAVNIFSSVETSPDGFTWTSRSAAAALSWEGICFSIPLGLFIVTATTGFGARVMTSPDAINWTLRNSPDAKAWSAVVSGLVPT